jgi:hypothetical protein
MPGSPAAAQWRAAVETGVGSTGLEANSGSLASISPSLSWRARWFRLDAEGSFADLGQGEQSAAGRLGASLFTPLGRHFVAEAYGNGLGLAGSREETSSGWIAGPRLHLLQSQHGVWLGAGLGAESGIATRRWELGLWRQWGPMNLQLQAGQTMIESTLRRIEVSPDTLVRGDTVVSRGFQSRTDLAAWLHWNRGAMQLGLGLGRQPRVGRADVWWETEAVWWLASRIAVVGAAGDRATDLTLGIPGGRFVLLSLRATLDRRAPAPVVVPEPREVAGFRVRRVDDSIVELSVPSRGTSLVEIMGDFTDWQSEVLEPSSGGWWRIELPLAPGVHFVNVRFNSGAWEVPAGVSVAPDEFGGMVGRVVVR